VIAGFGIGITLGPLALQAQYSHPARFAAVLVTLNLFVRLYFTLLSSYSCELTARLQKKFRNLGGTIGLAQLSAVLESKIRSYIRHLVSHGDLTPKDASLIFSSLHTLSGRAGGGLNDLPNGLRNIVTEAYKLGTSDAFLSLVPWCGVGLILCAFLHNIQDPQHEAPHPAAPTSTASGDDAVLSHVIGVVGSSTATLAR
jgi:hypothetical protein